MPRAAMYPFLVGTTTPESRKHGIEVWHLPHYPNDLDVTIETGRHHQIRRHFDAIGHPVLGDPRYGAGNKNREGMRLAAVYLAVVEPFSGEEIELKLHGPPAKDDPRVLGADYIP